MAWKMFAGGQDTLLLHSADKGCAQACYQTWVLSIGTDVDHRIGGIVVHIQYWSQDPTHAECSGLLPRYLSLGKGPALGSRGSYGHIPGKGGGAANTKIRSPLEVRGN